MSRKKSREELEQHSERALKQIRSYIDDLLNSSNSDDDGRADKLLYWLEDYIGFLRTEETFNPAGLKRYRRGDVIKAHLGYNVGNEEGGLHFAIVLDNKNPLSSGILTVVPLTSIKPNKKKQGFYPGSIDLGNEIYLNFSKIISSSRSKLINEIPTLIEELSTYSQSIKDITGKIESIEGSDLPTHEKELDLLIVQKSNVMLKVQDMIKKHQQCIEEYDRLDKATDEIQRMKTGSIALISQIRTISKIRIYNPKNSYDTLNGVRVSAETLDKIDKAIADLYQKPQNSGNLVRQKKSQKNA